MRRFLRISAALPLFFIAAPALAQSTEQAPRVLPNAAILQGETADSLRDHYARMAEAQVKRLQQLNDAEQRRRNAEAAGVSNPGGYGSSQNGASRGSISLSGADRILQRELKREQERLFIDGPVGQLRNKVLSSVYPGGRGSPSQLNLAFEYYRINLDGSSVDVSPEEHAKYYTHPEGMTCVEEAAQTYVDFLNAYFDEPLPSGNFKTLSFDDFLFRSGASNKRKYYKAAFVITRMPGPKPDPAPVPRVFITESDDPKHSDNNRLKLPVFMYDDGNCSFPTVEQAAETLLDGLNILKAQIALGQIHEAKAATSSLNSGVRAAPVASATTGQQVGIPQAAGAYTVTRNKTALYGHPIVPTSPPAQFQQPAGATNAIPLQR